MTTTAKNTKISPNSPAKKSPGNAPSPQTLGRITQKICRNGPNPPPPPNDPPPVKKIPLLENQAKLSNSLSSDILQKGDVNHMKPT